MGREVVRVTPCHSCGLGHEYLHGAYGRVTTACACSSIVVHRMASRAPWFRHRRGTWQCHGFGTDAEVYSSFQDLQADGNPLGYYCAPLRATFFRLCTHVQDHTTTLHLPACAARASDMYKALLCCSAVYSEQADTETARLGGVPRVGIK